jgi:putative transposase
MRKSRFTGSQIVAILKEGEAGMPVAEVCRKHAISAPTYCAWKSKYAGATASVTCPLPPYQSGGSPG